MASNLQIIDALGTYLDGKIIDQLVSHGKLASSTLLNSIKHEVRETLNGVEVTGSMIYYGKFVESGRKKGTYVPIGPLMEWIRLKGIENDIEKAKGIAFAISKTIKQKGIKPFPFIEKAIEGSLAEIDARVSQVSRPIIEKELDIIFQFKE